MPVHTFYRISIWLPVALPAVVAILVHGAGVPVPSGLLFVVQILLMSFLYGGVPYFLLAVWATWWVGGRPEREITRLMIRAPFLMVGMFFLVALVVGLFVGQPGLFTRVGLLGAAVIIPLGYVYVGVVWVLGQWIVLRPA